MNIKCPHCGGVLEITKAQNLTAAQTVGKPAGTLASGVVKATGESIEKKTVKQVSETVDAVLSSLTALNNLASGNLSKSNDGLASGWSGAMAGALRARMERMESGGDASVTDSEELNKEAAAKKIQRMLHGALNKKSEDTSEKVK